VKSVTLKLANVYTNSNTDELEEVLNIVIPMLLDDCFKSTIQMVKFSAIDLLFEIIKVTILVVKTG